MHGDDYVASGEDGNLKWFAGGMRKCYGRTVQTLGPSTEDGKVVQVLVRSISWQTLGKDEVITYEADPRHAEIIVKEMGVEHCKPLSSPASKMDSANDQDEDVLAADKGSTFRPLVARANCVAWTGRTSSSPAMKLALLYRLQRLEIGKC